MVETVMCYIENEENQYLMLYRCKKENDLNEGKWLGIGGHIEIDESPEEAIFRETLEETGLRLKSINKRGVITFINNDYEELIHLYTSNDYEGSIIECNEGDLHWINKNDIFNLSLWEGDKLFLNKLINNDEYFEMKLHYDNDIFLYEE